MNLKSKIIYATAIVSCVVCSISAQINILSNTITFREANNAARSTSHYGDLHLEGGTSGSSWGWLYCNRAAVYGDLVVTGTKNFMQPHPTDSNKVIKYIAIESGEALTLVRGTATTVNGQAIVPLPEHFKLVTSSDVPVTVILTPENAPVTLYTKGKSKEQIAIGMKNSDFFEFGDVQFSYQVTGVRDGFENEEVIVDINNKIGQESISEKRAVYNERVKNLAKKMKTENKNK